MTDRSVVYRLQADITSFQAKMAQASASARKAAGDLGTSVEKGGSKASSALDSVGINATTVALGIGTAMVVATANFEKAMSGVQAATHESAASMDELRQAALDAGAQTSFSATEAAAGIENLAKAGVSTDAILSGGLAGALDLAAAGELQVAEAADIAATALTQFKLEGADVPHVADLLAAGAGKAQGSVTDMGMALKQSGLVAAQTGLTIEETTGTLAAFASAGLTGSDAGTSFKTMLQSLTPSSTKARNAMEKMGFSAYDAQGNFKGMEVVAGELRAGLAGMSQEQQNATLKTIFGSDAVRAAAVIYEQGAEGIGTWIDKTNDAGYAAETAAIQMDNLKGDVEALQGALETALIEGGSDSQGGLRGLTQLTTDAVNLSTEVSKTDGVLGGLRDTASSAINPLGGLVTSLTGLKGALFGSDEPTEELDTKTESLAQSATAAAGGLDAQAVSLQGVGGAVKRTTEDLEAIAKAQKEAREAAHGTASAFVNLGDDVSNAKVSLGEWIAQMANQADALNNFMTNAKTASKRGLRDGLIRDLQDAGPEGALRLKQLANASDAEIARANAAWKRGQKAIQDYIDMKVPPKKVDVDTDRALTAIEIIRNALKNIRDEEVIVRVTRSGTGAQSPGFGPTGSADGGTVPKTGKAYADRHLYLLADGEEVVSNRHGQADKWRPMLKAISGGLADGGTSGKGKRGTGGVFVMDNTASLEESIRRLTEVQEHQTEAVDRDIATRDEWAAKMADVAKGTISGFSTGLFAKDSKPWAAGAGGGPMANLTEDIAGLTERASLQEQLAGMGITGDALSALLSEGTNADLSSLIASGQAPDVAAAYAQRAALQGSTGSAAGQMAYGSQYAAADRAAQASAAAAQQTNVEIAGLRGQVGQLTAALAAAAETAGNSFGETVRGEVVKGHREKVSHR